jgi:guanylate kinase
MATDAAECALRLASVEPALDRQPESPKESAETVELQARLKKAEDEEPVGRAMSDHIVVNDDLDATVEEIVRIIGKRRQTRP